MLFHTTPDIFLRHPFVFNGKPTLALKEKELDIAVADAEEAWVFLSGLQRDQACSDKLQALRRMRESYGITVTRSSLFVQRSKWELFGALPHMCTSYRGQEVSRFYYLCVLPDNQPIFGPSALAVRMYQPVFFTEPVTGYMVSFLARKGPEDAERWITEEGFCTEQRIFCSLNGIPYEQFNDIDWGVGS